MSAPCFSFGFNPENRDGMFLQNVDSFLQIHKGFKLEGQHRHV
jgi:hypothetical protein